MPKAAPDQVIIHRIEFQETERDLLRWAAGAYTFRNASRGVFNLTSDVTTVVVLLIVYEWITEKTIIDDTLLAAIAAGEGIAQALADNWNAYRQSAQYQEDYGGRATSFAGGLRNVLDNLIGLFTGEYVERVLENLNGGSNSGGF